MRDQDIFTLYHESGGINARSWPDILRFARLIESATLERCAKMCGKYASAEKCAAAIRAPKEGR